MKPDSFQINLPVEGPLSREAFFELRSLRGSKPCRRLGLGAAGLGGAWGAVDHSESISVARRAWEAGFMLLDTAPNYGRSEEVVGEALRSWHGADPVLLTKIEGYPNYVPGKMGDTWRQSFEMQLAGSVKHFGGRRIHGLAMHDANGAPPEFTGECTAFLHEALERGRIGAVGLGGCGPQIQSRALVDPAFGYLITFKRIGALSLQALGDTVPLARKHGVTVIVASPVFMGILGSKHEQLMADPPKHFAPVFVERARQVKRMADAWGVPLSQLALRFALSMPAVDFVLTGACTPTEWADSQAAYEAGPLPSELYEQVWAAAQAGDEPLAGG